MAPLSTFGEQVAAFMNWQMGKIRARFCLLQCDKNLNMFFFSYLLFSKRRTWEKQLHYVLSIMGIPSYDEW